MDRVFFEQLCLPEAKYNLEVGSSSHAEQTGKILWKVEKVLIEEEPDVVLVEGDTNTVLAGALAACKLNIRVGHVEAGLRSYDRRMPEEINRVLTDHCSDYLFAPTNISKSILLGEGLPEEKIFVTGNTIVDAVHQNLEIASKAMSFLRDMGLKSKKYFLATVHRQENVDDKNRFSSILEGLELVSERFDIPIVYPVHPRARKMMERFGLSPRLMLIDPLNYLTFLQLEKEAGLILTDSGGVQEEACILGVPCVTLRDNTERSETVDVGANIIAGVESREILNHAWIMFEKKRDWSNPFGDGTAAIKIIEILRQQIDDK